MLDVLLQPVECLDISVRAANALLNMGALRLGDVVQFTEGDILRTKNVGRKTLKEIRTALASFGLWLGMMWSNDLTRAYDEAVQRGATAVPPSSV